MNIVTCDECSKDFRMKPKKKRHGFTIEEIYFTCPHCKHKYIGVVTDPDCRKLQLAIRKEQDQKNVVAQQYVNKAISEEDYKKQIDFIDSRIKNIQNELQPKLNELKQSYS